MVKHWWFSKDHPHEVYEVGLHEWANRFERENRVVMKTVVDDHEVSTVFLGIDHGHDTWSKPLVWETMVFGPRIEYTERYWTYVQAARGHMEVVMEMMAGGDPNEAEKLELRADDATRTLDGGPCQACKGGPV